MYTEYQVRATLITILERALTEMGVEGFTVLARNPPNIVTGKNVVLVDLLFSMRMGFQGRQYDADPSLPAGFKETERWLAETTFQISVIRQATLEDDLLTQTNDDVAASLIAWLDSRRGAATMRRATPVPMAPIYTKRRNLRAYTDDNDVHQHEVTFDLAVQYVQTKTFVADPLSDINGEQHPL